MIQNQKVQCQSPFVISSILQRTPATDNRQMSFFQLSDLDSDVNALKLKRLLRFARNDRFGTEDLLKELKRRHTMFQPATLSQSVKVTADNNVFNEMAATANSLSPCISLAIT